MREHFRPQKEDFSVGAACLGTGIVLDVPPERDTGAGAGIG